MPKNVFEKEPTKQLIFIYANPVLRCAVSIATFLRPALLHFIFAYDFVSWLSSMWIAPVMCARDLRCSAFILNLSKRLNVDAQYLNLFTLMVDFNLFISGQLFLQRYSNSKFILY